MNADIRTAGIDERFRARLKMATDLLQAYQILAKLSDWDGTRCHCLIAADSDAYGDHASSVAQRQKIPVLRLSANGASFDASTNTIGQGAPLNLFAHTLVSLLKNGTEQSEAVVAGSPALITLANEAVQYEKDFRAHVDGVEIFVLRSSGQVAAKEKSDVLAARDRLCSAGWRFQETSVRADHGFYLESLDTFLIRGATQNADALPPFPDGLYRLKYWPDLGSATDLMDALRVSNLIQAKAMSSSAISQHFGMSAAQVSAILWSFKASSLLVSENPVGGNRVSSRPGRRAPANTLLKKLAARFGLTREL